MTDPLTAERLAELRAKAHLYRSAGAIRELLAHIDAQAAEVAAKEELYQLAIRTGMKVAAEREEQAAEVARLTGERDDRSLFIQQQDKEIHSLKSQVGTLQAQLAAAQAEVERLRGAIRRAGFAVMETSGDWSIHDVSEYGKAEEARTAEVVSENARLHAEASALRAENERLRTDLNDTSRAWKNSCEMLAAQAATIERLRAARSFIVAADSELSAIGHGRRPSGKSELIRISDGLRSAAAALEGPSNG